MAALLHPDAASPPPVSAKEGSATVCVFLSVPRLRARRACARFTDLCPNLRSAANPFSPKCWTFLAYTPHASAAVPLVQYWHRCQLNPEEATLPCLTSAYFTLSRTSTFLARFGFFFSPLFTSSKKKDWRGINFQLCRKRKRKESKAIHIFTMKDDIAFTEL